MKRTIHAVIFLTLFLCLCVLPAGAASLSIPDNCTNLLTDEREFPELLDAMGDSAVLKMEPNEYTQAILNMPAWKVYTLISQDLLAGLQSEAPVTDLISEEYVWDVLRPDARVRLANKNGAWTPIGSAPSNSGDVVDLDAVSAHLTVLEQDNPGTALLVQCFRAPKYHTTFVLIAHGTAEYLVPFCARPEFTGLQNGVLYSRQEVLQALELHFSAASSGNYNGGSGDTASAFPWVLCGVIAAAAMLFVIVFLRTKKVKA